MSSEASRRMQRDNSPASITFECLLVCGVHTRTGTRETENGGDGGGGLKKKARAKSFKISSPPQPYPVQHTNQKTEIGEGRRKKKV